MQASHSTNHDDTGEMPSYVSQPTRAAAEDRLPESHGNLLGILSALKGPSSSPSRSEPELPADLREILLPYANTLKVSAQKLESLRQESLSVEQRHAESWDALGFRERYLPRPLIGLFGGDRSALEQLDGLREYHARIESARAAEQTAFDKTQAKADFIVEEHLIKTDGSYLQLFSTLGSLSELQRAAKSYDDSISGALSIFLKARWEEQHSFLISVPWAPASAHLVGEHAQASIDTVAERHAEYSARARDFVAKCDPSLAEKISFSAAADTDETERNSAAQGTVLFGVASMLSVLKLRDVVDKLDDLDATLKKERMVLDALEGSLKKELADRCRRQLDSCFE